MFYLEFETSGVLTQLDLNLDWFPWDKSWPLGVTHTWSAYPPSQTLAWRW